jgi:small GTP-binding protein
MFSVNLSILIFWKKNLFFIEALLFKLIMNEFEDYDMEFKLVLIGNSSVGKSNILNRYTKDLFTLNTKSTLGVEFSAKSVRVGDQIVKAQIWDTAGQERYKSVTNTYYKNSKAAFIIYDITNKKSFEDVDSWYSDLKDKADSDIVIYLIGNKIDLESYRVVSETEGQQKAENYGIKFLETSAMINYNINKAFTSIIDDVYDASFMQKIDKVKIPNYSIVKVVANNTIKQQMKKSCC